MSGTAAISEALAGRRKRAREASSRYRERKRRTRQTMAQVDCECGCGTKIPAVTWNGKSARFAVGHSARYFGHASRFKSSEMTGANNPRWRGGATKEQHSNGYIRICFAPSHPLREKYGRRILEHRLVMAEAIGRLLDPTEQVHHINGNRSDNRLDNLQLLRGNHGSGAAYCCRDCGSLNVGAVALEGGDSLVRHMGV